MDTNKFVISNTGSAQLCVFVLEAAELILHGLVYCMGIVDTQTV